MSSGRRGETAFANNLSVKGELEPASGAAADDGPPALLRYLLGLEGLALLRGWLATDGRAAACRLSEISALLESTDELRETAAPVEVSRREGYAAWASSYDLQPNPLVEVEDPIVRGLLADGSPGRALDAACGTGRLLGVLASLGHEVIGVDESPEMLAVARRREPQADLREADLRALPLADHSFDLAVCALALSHSNDLVSPLRELVRVLRPGARLVTSHIHPLLSALGGEALFTRADGTPAFVREKGHLHGDYLSAFAAAGLEVRACLEPAWEPRTAAMVGKAARRVPEALRDALVGLPCVLVWELVRK